MGQRIYFDHSATTPLDPRVAAEMAPYLSAHFGNPSSLHTEGREARAAVELARARVGVLHGAEPEQVVFTASGTEADNLALLGATAPYRGQPCHVITSAIEHPAVLQCCRLLERQGVEVSYLPVTGEGLVEPQTLASALRPHTRLVSIMAANNVMGALQPLSELADVARGHGVVFHTDAVQAAGKVPLDLRELPIDLISLSAHKLHGPKGAGALVVGSGVPLSPVIHGGGQERGLRSATENVAGLVGFGAAAEVAAAEMAEEGRRLLALRTRLLAALPELTPNAYLIGPRVRRLPGHLCLGLAGQEGEAIRLLLALDQAGIAVSSGSACSASHATEPSYVLTAMGFDAIRSRGSLRISLGRFNTEEEIDRFLPVFAKAARELRSVTTTRS